MKNILKYSQWLGVIFLAVFMTGCVQSSTPDLTMAGTYAAQTLTAIPADTEMPPPIETIEADAPTATPSLTPNPIMKAVGPVDFPEDVNPLTGLRLEDPSILDRRPVLVKVANYPTSGRPHAGLSFADMVFEYYIGAGGNRFVGLFYGQESEQIGPVRSGRLIDPYIVSLYEGILGMEGAYITVLNHITEILGNRVISGRGTCPAICDDGRYIVTSVFANSEEMTKYAEAHGVDQQRYKLEGMAFDQLPPAGGVVGEKATILFSTYNRGEWHYDDESGQYLRWIETDGSADMTMIPLVDRITDEQLAFSNVVVIFANYTEIAPTLHDVDLWNETGQRAVVFRDGQAYDITWSTPSKNQPIQFLDGEGQVLPLKPGNTWVVIFGENSNATEDEGEWTFDFRMP